MNCYHFTDSIMDSVNEQIARQRRSITISMLLLEDWYIIRLADAAAKAHPPVAEGAFLRVLFY